MRNHRVFPEQRNSFHTEDQSLLQCSTGVEEQSSPIRPLVLTHFSTGRQGEAYFKDNTACIPGGPRVGLEEIPHVYAVTKKLKLSNGKVVYIYGTIAKIELHELFVLVTVDYRFKRNKRVRKIEFCRFNPLKEKQG